MNLKSLTYTNIRFYLRYYKLIATAALVAVAVIVGSIMVGESVRLTLVAKVYERLGNTETVLFSKNSFFESSLTSDSLFEGKGRAILLVNGFISDAGRLIPVMVWGIDDEELLKGSVKINSALRQELHSTGDIVLRLPATGMVPSGSLFVTDNYTTSTRLAYAGIVDVANGGNINLKNEQSVPYNVFVNRTELASVLEVEGKINLILTDKHISQDDLTNIWNPALSGLSAQNMGEFYEVTSDRVFLQQEVVETICRNNHEANRMFSYLANSITYLSNTGKAPYPTLDRHPIQHWDDTLSNRGKYSIFICYRCRPIQRATIEKRRIDFVELYRISSQRESK